MGMLQGFNAGHARKKAPPRRDDGPADKRLVNLLTITGEEQVALKVTIAEVQREVIKQLGINTEAIIEGEFGFEFSNPTTFPFNTDVLGSQSEIGVSWTNGDDSVSATVEALEETRMLRTLAEPTLTAVSGETANFLVGGEFPVPVGSDDDEITVEFKPFGVNLAFTPVVLSAGRISLKVRTRSERHLRARSRLGADRPERHRHHPWRVGAPRRNDGRAALRRLLRDRRPDPGEHASALHPGFPGLQQLPVLGMLFSSKDFLNNQTELVMIVTPYLVKPTSPRTLARPDQNLIMASDAEAYLLNRLTKVYGTAAQVPADGRRPGRLHFRLTEGHVGIAEMPTSNFRPQRPPWPQGAGRGRARSCLRRSPPAAARPTLRRQPGRLRRPGSTSDHDLRGARGLR